MLQYYRILHKIFHDNPDLRKCLKKCKHCGILFLTDKRNSGRNDIRCPFGCRQSHRKMSSTKRSIEYYQTDEGKFKKKLQNDKRNKNKPTNTEPPEEIIPDETCINYIRALVSMLERRKVSRGEILSMIKKVLRQHSIAGSQKKHYFRNKSGP